MPAKATKNVNYAKILNQMCSYSTQRDKKGIEMTEEKKQRALNFAVPKT
jgi:hypothetical protein